MIDIKEKDPIKVGRALSRKILRGIGNKKLGDYVYSFSLPAGKAYSCPDASELCERLCYVENFSKRYPGVMRSYIENLELTERKDFGKILDEALSRLPGAILRIHVSGDFYSVKYIDDWHRALQNNPHIKAFGFTRAWRDKRRRKAMEDRRMNLPIEQGGYILASVDDETGPCPSNWREARMRTDVLLKRVQRRQMPIPKYLCNEQHPTIGSVSPCQSCGRCVGFKIKSNEEPHTLVQLTGAVVRSPITFALH